MIGEALLEKSINPFRIMTLNEFCKAVEGSESHFKNLIKELERILLLSKEKQVRQTILVFGAIVAMLINHFDSKHKIVRYRKLYLNKLSEKSSRMIDSGLFNHYLPSSRTRRNIKGLPPGLHDYKKSMPLESPVS